MIPLSHENWERKRKEEQNRKNRNNRKHIDEFKKVYQESKKHGYNTNHIIMSFKNKGLSNNKIQNAINSMGYPKISINNV